MRTIRDFNFRVFNKEKKDWEASCYLIGYFLIHKDQKKDEITYIMQQWTGLTDINGRDIYEGDILAEIGFEDDETFTVEWDNENSMYHYGRMGHLHRDDTEHLVIVDNIFHKDFIRNWQEAAERINQKNSTK